MLRRYRYIHAAGCVQNLLIRALGMTSLQEKPQVPETCPSKLNDVALSVLTSGGTLVVFRTLSSNFTMILLRDSEVIHGPCKTVPEKIQATNGTRKNLSIAFIELSSGFGVSNSNLRIGKMESFARFARKTTNWTMGTIVPYCYRLQCRLHSTFPCHLPTTVAISKKIRGKLSGRLHSMTVNNGPDLHFATDPRKTAMSW